MNIYKVTAEKGSDSYRGTGFIINRKGILYLVTAKHLVLPLSTQKDYTLPTFENSLEEIKILNTTNFEVIHQESLLDYELKEIKFKFFNRDSDKALDIAVIKLNNPNKLLISESIPFNQLAKKKSIKYEKSLKIYGHPSKNDGLHIATANYIAKDYQEMLGNDKKYFFILEGEMNLKGMSGGPIFTFDKSGKNKIIGIFVGQNNKLKTLGYGIYSSYIRKIILKY